MDGSGGKAAYLLVISMSESRGAVLGLERD